MARSKAQTQTIKDVFMYLSVIGGIVMVFIGGLALWAHTFTSNMVRTELAAQKIYFPEKGSKALDPGVYPDLQQYASQLVDTPEKAKAYANGYIGRHLQQMAGGKVYAEVSTESTKDPDNKELQQLKQKLFQGETLRGMLLTSGYGFGTAGKIAGIAAYVAFGVGLVLFITAATLYIRR